MPIGVQRTMMRTQRTLAMLALTAVVGCSPATESTTPTATHTNVLRLDVTTASAPLGEVLFDAYMTDLIAPTIETVVANHTSLLQRLLTTESDYMLSYHRPAAQDLWAAPILQDGLGVFVHPDNPIEAITTSQLRQLYQGFIDDWQQLSTFSQVVTIYSREIGSGLRLEFERLVMGPRQTSPNARSIPTVEAALESVSSDPGGIAYAPLSQIDASVKLLRIDAVYPDVIAIKENRYPLRLTLHFIGRSAPSNDYASLFNWLQSPSAEQVFVPLSGIPLAR